MASNCDGNYDLCVHFGVEQIPTIFMFDFGKLYKFDGKRGQAEIVNFFLGDYVDFPFYHFDIELGVMSR